MKHLKQYKIFEEATYHSKYFFEDINVDLNDILLEVKDMDYETSIFYQHDRYKLVRFENIKWPASIDYIKIIIRKSPFVINEVEDCVNRLLEYMDSKEIFRTELYLYRDSTRKSQISINPINWERIIEEDKKHPTFDIIIEWIVK